MLYNVELNYNAKFLTTVDAKDEGEAYAKAREQSELAESGQFIIGLETESSLSSAD